jgi:hypothetical protein
MIRFGLLAVSRFFDWRSALVIVKPETFIKWHRTAFRAFWRWKFRRPGRPSLPKNLRQLVRRMSEENPTWGEERIANEFHGDAALPWLRRAAPETNQPALRFACARELVVAGEPEGFQYLLQAMDDGPSFSRDVIQFARDRFPELRDADQGKMLDFLRIHAAATR